jgi:ribosomal-protein-alanine N-acetyltransferase
MEEVLIEKMKETDLADVLAIEQASFPTPFTLNLFRMELNLNVAHLFVARKQQKIVGYIDFWRVGPEAHLITIGVDPKARKHGVGSKLVAFMLEDVKRNRVESVSLDVRPTNAAALKLYEKFGFRQVGVRKKYYQDNDEDALVLGLALKESEQPSGTVAE